MPRFAANLSLLFTEVPLQNRFAAAHAALMRASFWLMPTISTALWMIFLGPRMSCRTCTGYR